VDRIIHPRDDFAELLIEQTVGLLTNLGKLSGKLIRLKLSRPKWFQVNREAFTSQNALQSTCKNRDLGCPRRWRGVVFSLHCQVVLGFYILSTLKNPFKHRRRGGDNNRAECDEDAYKNSACAIITIAQHNEKFSHRNKTDNG
jgi:hypothetical protein